LYKIKTIYFTFKNYFWNIIFICKQFFQSVKFLISLFTCIHYCDTFYVCNYVNMYLIVNTYSYFVISFFLLTCLHLVRMVGDFSSNLNYIPTKISLNYLFWPKTFFFNNDYLVLRFLNFFIV